MAVGLICAFGAALAMGVASILQAAGARRSPVGTGLQAGRLVRLIGHPLYVAGLSLDLVGAVALVVALQRLPLFLVQSAMASSVGVTAIIAAILGTRIQRMEWAALGGLGLGLILLAMAAAPESSKPISSLWIWVMLCTAVPIAALAAVAARSKGNGAAMLMALCCGLSYSMVAIAARVLRFPSPWWGLLSGPAVWVIVVHGALATALFAMALQRGSVVTVTALTFTTEVIVPSVVGLAFLGDSARPGFGIVAVLGFVVAIAGALSLAKFAEPPLPAEDGNEIPPDSDGRHVAVTS